MERRPDCYRCVHRRPLPGNTHSKCAHPSTAAIHAHPLIAIAGVNGGLPSISPERLGVSCHPHGEAKGWFSWPVNYDPVWLLTCNGFTAKAEAP